MELSLDVPGNLPVLRQSDFRQLVYVPVGAGDASRQDPVAHRKVEAVLDRVASASTLHFEKPRPDESVGPRRGRGRRLGPGWRRGRRGAGAAGEQNRYTR